MDGFPPLILYFRGRLSGKNELNESLAVIFSWKLNIRQIMKLRDGIFVLGFLLGGIMITWFGVIDYQERQSNFDNAVEVDGTIQNIEVHEEQELDEVVYRPNITYRYTFHETQYTDNTIYPGIYQFTKGSRESAEEYASRYSIGETIPVYVNSQDPTEAFLTKDADSWLRKADPLLTVALGSLMTLISGGFSILVIIQRIGRVEN